MVVKFEEGVSKVFLDLHCNNECYFWIVFPLMQHKQGSRSNPRLLNPIGPDIPSSHLIVLTSHSPSTSSSIRRRVLCYPALPQIVKCHTLRPNLAFLP
ncbi:hypothetical protein CPC08DRAFT_321204 [Agrocybe pediades]|nr:hypothetical protein CPC08DRAFT_321204 [Agrocybe pediades]